jgi:hypothetical protein
MAAEAAASSLRPRTISREAPLAASGIAAVRTSRVVSPVFNSQPVVIIHTKNMLSGLTFVILALRLLLVLTTTTRFGYYHEAPVVLSASPSSGPAAGDFSEMTKMPTRM